MAELKMENNNIKFKIVSWKSWPYWLRGGVTMTILGLAGLFYLCLNGTIKISTSVVSCIKAPCPATSFLVEINNIQVWTVEGIIIFLLEFTIFTLIAGVLIGWFYGKIKNWKIFGDWPYWVKGGIIGLFIGTVAVFMEHSGVSILYSVSGLLSIFNLPLLIPIIILEPTAVPFIVYAIILRIFGESYGTLLFFTIAPFVLSGIFWGWLYGKIKNRKLIIPKS